MKLEERSILALIALGLAWLPAQAIAEQMVVVAARGIALHPGDKIDSEKPLVLTQGQHVTLIAINGVTINLNGPYDKPPAASSNGKDLSSALSALATQQQARTTEVGATRAGTAVANLPDPWLLDISRTGNVCLPNGRQTVLWRPDTVKSPTVTITAADRSWSADLNWPEGSDRLVMPIASAIHGGAIYDVAFAGSDEHAVTVNIVPADLPSVPMEAAWLAHQGCEAQAEALLRTQR
ncbi:MAG TPA: hypothetical protein VL993_19680 [Stellaceae bacterium]|nr:hypothetical protein [Stellaceae bacterium]